MDRPVRDLAVTHHQVTMRYSVKPIAPDFVPPRQIHWKRIKSSFVRNAPVKNRIENRHHRQIGRHFRLRRANYFESGAIVQGRDLLERLDPADYFFSNPRRPIKAIAAMHNAMSDAFEIA